VPGRGRGLLLHRAHGPRAPRAVRVVAPLTAVGTELDHIAIAVERWADAWPRFVVELGGRWASGGRGPGFAPSQYEFADGMRLEVLEPNDVDRSEEHTSELQS